MLSSQLALVLFLLPGWGIFVFNDLGDFLLDKCTLSLAGYLMNNHGMVSNILGFAMAFFVLGMLVVLCKVFRGKKGRPP